MEEGLRIPTRGDAMRWGQGLASTLLRGAGVSQTRPAPPDSGPTAATDAAPQIPSTRKEDDDDDDYDHRAIAPFFPSKKAVIAGTMNPVAWVPGYLKLDRFSDACMPMQLHFSMLRMLAHLVPGACINEGQVLTRARDELASPTCAVRVPPQLRADIATLVQTPADFPFLFLGNPTRIVYTLILDNQALESARSKQVYLSLLLEYCLWWNEQLRLYMLRSAQSFRLSSSQTDAAVWDRWYQNAQGTMHNMKPMDIQWYIRQIAMQQQQQQSTPFQAWFQAARKAPDAWAVVRFLFETGIFSAKTISPSSLLHPVLQLFLSSSNNSDRIPARARNPLFLLHALAACLSVQTERFSPDTQACLHAVSNYGEGINPTLLSGTAQTALSHAVDHFVDSLQEKGAGALLTGGIDRALARLAPKNALDTLMDRAVARLKQEASSALSPKRIGTLVGVTCASLLVELELLQHIVPLPATATADRRERRGLFVQQPATTASSVFRPVVIAAYPLLFLLTHRLFQRLLKKQS